MHGPEQFRTSIFRTGLHVTNAVLALVIVCAFTITAQSAQAQTFTVIHTFTGGTDGGMPMAGVTVGPAGVLYGANYFGGAHNCGAVFKLSHQGAGWTLNPLYEFTQGDSCEPEGPVTVGPTGALYGTTEYSSSDVRGTVFEVRPPATACRTAICYWNETVLHTFHGGTNDGASPASTNLVFDRAGNMYGTTQYGGSGLDYQGGPGGGTVFELSPSSGGWSFSIVHNFNNDGTDGYDPSSGVTSDVAGNLYGTTYYGGTFGEFGGAAFELTPSDGTWSENIIYNFSNPGSQLNADPSALIVDQSGNLYGSTGQGGDSGDGSVFELTRSQGGWVFSTLYAFATHFCGPGPVARDSAGNLYGTCAGGGANGAGWAFKLTNSGGSWTATDLYDFTGGSDGALPEGPVVLDSNGNLYGTTPLGGLLFGCEGEGCGTVWEITP